MKKALTIPAAEIVALEDATADAHRELKQVKERLELAATGPNEVLAAAAKGLLYDVRAMLQRLKDRCPCLLGRDIGACCTCLECGALCWYEPDPFAEDA